MFRKSIFGCISFALVLSVFACSSNHSTKNDPATTTPPPDTGGGDGGTPDVVPGDDTGTSSGGSSSGSSGSTPPPTNAMECVVACQVKYPTADAQDKTLTACMLNEKTGGDVCNGLVANGTNFPPPDVDGGAVCNTDAANSYPIMTPSKDCSSHIAQYCCKEWTTLYSSDEGKALSACAVDCFTKFKN